MSDRLLCDNVFETVLPHAPLPPDEIDEGTPSAGVADFGRVGATDVGIWEMSEGVARDTEAEEIFVVLSGAGSVSFQDGSTLALTPGVAVRLYQGEQTVWTITERLRKIYVALP